MKNNYGIALCPEEANCTLKHSQLLPLIPISLQLPSADEHTETENDNSEGIVKDWPSPCYLYSLRHPLSVVKFSAKSLLTPMQKRVKGPKPEYQWIGEANSIRLGKYLPCPPGAPKGCLYFTAVQPRNKARQIEGTLHTISLPLPWCR
jgi:hypothetical protein